MKTTHNNTALTVTNKREKDTDLAFVFLLVLLGIFLLLYFVFSGKSVIEKIGLQETISLIGNPQ